MARRRRRARRQSVIEQVRTLIRRYYQRWRKEGPKPK